MDSTADFADGMDWGTIEIKSGFKQRIMQTKAGNFLTEGNRGNGRRGNVQTPAVRSGGLGGAALMLKEMLCFISHRVWYRRMLRRNAKQIQINLTLPRISCPIQEPINHPNAQISWLPFDGLD